MKKSLAIRKRAERIRQLDRPEREKRLQARFSERDFSSDELIKIKGLCKSFGSRVLFQDVELYVEGGERIALIGDNGTGKTTFIHILMGIEAADKGFARLGPAVKAAYLPQVIKLPRIRSFRFWIMVINETGCTPQTARNMLGAFKFSGRTSLKRYPSFRAGN